MNSNQAAWQVKKGQPLEIGPAEYPKPTANQIAIRNHAVAINPVDWFVQILGNIIFPWVKFPVILGGDVAGSVELVGSDVTRFKPGDRVVGVSLGITKNKVDSSQGGFQEMVILREDMCAPIPDDITFEQACVLGLGFCTAACGLYQKDYLNLPLPQAKNVKNTGQTLLIWGGSTSVGNNAIQLARASGYQVFTTCSPNNFDLVKRLGASDAWDYKSPTVVQDIVKAFKDKDCAGAFAIGAGSAEKCLSIVSKLKKTRKFVALASQPGQPEGIPEGLVGAAAAMSKMLTSGWIFRGRSLVTGVKSNFIFGSDLEGNEVGPGVWKDFLGEALANKSYVPSPEPLVVEKKGLEGIQEGFDVSRKGVRAKKVVISLL